MVGAPAMEVAEQNGESQGLGDGKSRMVEANADGDGKSQVVECCSLRLPDNLLAGKISRLMYTNSGLSILALTSNAVHKLWKWPENKKASSRVTPQLWQPTDSIIMKNKLNNMNPETVHCFAIDMYDEFLMSASGGEITLFNMNTFIEIVRFLPIAAATFLEFHPTDDEVIVIGMEDGTIQMQNVFSYEIILRNRLHRKRITGLAFSTVQNVLVSAGSDAQLIVWSTDAWKIKMSKSIAMQSSGSSVSFSDTRVQFHRDQTHFLVVQERRIAVYESPNLECRNQWTPRESTTMIIHAVYSCDGEKVYTCLSDGSISILCAVTLGLRHIIGPSAYLPPEFSSSTYLVTVAAHPSEPAQFAVGLTDGSVVVLEPSDHLDWPSLPSPEQKK